MAYSSYGGLAYRNGELVIERSDYVMRADGRVKGSPGVHPGFAALAEGATRDEVVTMGQDCPMAHAVLGEHPLLLLLYKQTTARVFYQGRRIQSFEPTEEFWERARVETSEAAPAVEHHEFRPDVDDRLPAEVPRTKFEVVYRQGDQIGVYARVTIHDGEEERMGRTTTWRKAGTIWTGWSAYGAGAGFEEDTEDYAGRTNTELHNQALRALFA